MTPSIWVCRAGLTSCWDDNSTWSLLIDSRSWVIEVTCTYNADFASFALLIHEFSLTLYSQSEDKEVWTKGPAFLKSHNAMIRLINQPTLTFRLSASLSVQRKLSRGRARHSFLTFDCNWDMLDLNCCKRKPLSDKVHLLVSFMVLGYLESNREQVTLRLVETSKSNGSDAVRMLSPSWSLEVASVKSSFS